MTFKQAVVGVAVVAVGLLSSVAQAGVTKADWGKTADGTPVQIYTLSDNDLKVRIATYGARVVSIEAPDRKGKMGDVVLGYDNLGQYESDTTYFGSIVGRYGNPMCFRHRRHLAKFCYAANPGRVRLKNTNRVPLNIFPYL